MIINATDNDDALRQGLLPGNMYMNGSVVQIVSMPPSHHMQAQSQYNAASNAWPHSTSYQPTIERPQLTGQWGMIGGCLAAGIYGAMAILAVISAHKFTGHGWWVGGVAAIGMVGLIGVMKTLDEHITELRRVNMSYYLQTGERP